jgi:spermidine/putrescine transport system permease protein
MIRTLPHARSYDWLYRVYMIAFYTYLFAPLLVTAALAFNDSPFPSLPWQGFTLGWFTGDEWPRVGFFHAERLLDSLKTSVQVAVLVSLLSVVVGTTTAFLFEQEEFRFKSWLYFLMLAPLVIPGVILGISILAFANTMGLYFENTFGVDVPVLRPGFWLVVLGQFSFIGTLTTLMIAARLKKFDRTLEEAAMNLGANRFQVIRHITLPFLRPAWFSAAVVGFLMSFENFNTTLFLSGPEPTFPIMLYQEVRDGISPVINAASFVLILITALFALAALLLGRTSRAGSA